MAVAFSASLTQDISNLDVGNTVKFHADLNKGQAYSNSTGTFTANQDGVYHFIFTVGQRTSVASDPPVAVYLIINGMKTAGVVTDSPRTADPLKISQASNQLIVNMKAGDTAEVKVFGNPAKGIAGDGFSTFTGHLL